jgi:anti-anti-sigma regulatory factor
MQYLNVRIHYMELPQKLYDNEGFSLTLTETSGPEFASIAFKGDCSQSAFMTHSEEVIKALAELKATHIFINANGLEHVNSRFVGILIHLLGQEKNLGLQDPNQFLTDILDIIGILNAFDICKDFAEFVEVWTL